MPAKLEPPFVRDGRVVTENFPSRRRRTTAGGSTGRAAVANDPLLDSPMLDATNGGAADVYLRPGDFYFGGQRGRIRTVLGSCVSITMWHRRQRLGGMCHYMLPERRHGVRSHLDGRYADDAVALLLREIAGSGTCPGDYEIKLFGGGRMFGGGRRADGTTIGMRNVDAGRRLLNAHGLCVHGGHTAGIGHRNLIFDLASGRVWLQHVARVAAVDAEAANEGRRGYAA